MANMEGELRAAVAAIVALAERRRGETPELALATFDVKMMQRHRGEHHASRARYLLTDPAMAPAGVIGFGLDPVTDRPACAAAGQHHFLLPVAPSFPAMQRRLERCGFVPLEMIRHAQSRRRQIGRASGRERVCLYV